MGYFGGPRQTKEQREEILETYLLDPLKGTELAIKRGLSPAYAHKLALARGMVPRRGEQA